MKRFKKKIIVSILSIFLINELSFAQDTIRFKIAFRSGYFYSFHPGQYLHYDDFSHVYIAPSVEFKRQIVYGGLVISRAAIPYYEGTSDFKAGGLVGYEFSITNSPGIVSEYLFLTNQFITRYWTIVESSHGQTYSKIKWNQSINNTVLGLRSNIYFGQERSASFYFSLGYSFAYFMEKSEQFYSWMNSKEFNTSTRLSKKQINIDAGISVTLKTVKKKS